MKVTDLNRALNYVDEKYLMELDTPDKETVTMKNRKKVMYMLVAAVTIVALSATAYAADFLNIRSLETGRSVHYANYADMDRAISQTGLELTIPEQFTSGYRFEEVEVMEVKGRDESGKKVLTFRELSAQYRNSMGQRLVLSASPSLEEVPVTDSIASASQRIGDVEVLYYLDHYKWVPEDYKLTAEDESWQKQPGNYISYGADQVCEEPVAFLCWSENGVNYFFMDRNATTSKEVLFSMAAQMIEN